ncbi:hypothetical protein [Maribacter arcticus]|uniref:Outer membrane protein beta-barrel domain-containing protein n=1 Tax=Maribacter arcticus TaxID=561365 RepID=A0A1T5A137_9FLAO|nr:hypothetical protein [Maribacter arcticus]SKB28670.1 hypothetical protein SAMN05660866_00569 [Maribacter arcticus]
MKILKITSLLFLFMAFCIHSIQAQTKGSNQISMSYGAFSVYEYASMFFEDIESKGIASLNYKYAVKDRFMVGAAISYEALTGHTNDVLVAFGAEDTEREFTNITFAVETDYRYVSKPSFQMYSGIGVAYFTSDQYDTNLSFQINALGFRVGKKLAAYAELGFGYKGMAQLGASYQF